MEVLGRAMAESVKIIEEKVRRAADTTAPMERNSFNDFTDNMK
jgi:hypothetical protein